VLTLFSGSPCGSLSLLAKALHADWRLPKDAPALRREEDRQALAVLGAGALHADFLDCIYRRDPRSGKFVYRRLGQILGQETAGEPGLLEEIGEYLRDTIRSARYEHVFAPLALGGHVDHRITHAAVKRLASALPQTKFHYYEDLPYAIGDAACGERMKGMRSYICTRVDGPLQKYAAMACYTSQVKNPRYSGGIDIDAISNYGSTVSAHACAFAERVWRSEF
jgi:LmbE family N-acetylglucosaminyl deacetylase